MISTERVRCELKDGIALITFNNPPMNALNGEMMNDIRNCFNHLKQRQDVRAIVVTGEGKAFIAGADIKEFTSWTVDIAEDLTEKGQRIFTQIEKSPFPVIAAINGFAFGGGLELALACDIRIASEKAKMGFPEVTLGIIPGYGGTQRLARAIHPGKAKKMIYTAETIDALEAERIGLVDSVYPAETLLEEALKIAKKIAQNAPIAVRNAKTAITEGLNQPIIEGLNTELTLARECFATEDKIEGVNAFIEKRSAVFENK